MRFYLATWSNPGYCPKCHRKSARMWMCERNGRDTVVCCEACGPKEEER